MKNRFNNLTSKQWLPFQKSWFRFDNLTDVLVENILFFTQVREDDGYLPNIVLDFDKNSVKELQNYALLDKRRLLPFERFGEFDRIDFAVFNLLPDIERLTSPETFNVLLAELSKKIREIGNKLIHRKFVLILAKNKTINGVFYPFAWQIGKYFQSVLSLKDEKIGIDLSRTEESAAKENSGFKTGDNVIYSLYFRKDEMSSMEFEKAIPPKILERPQDKTSLKFDEIFPSHQIVKPPPRKKNEILHPAKYPEVLIESFIKHFTVPGDNVFDPMSGTGSTQLAALTLGRNAYGTELSPFFADIARQRCTKYVSQTNLFNRTTNKFQIKIKDARTVTPDEFPPIHYIVTSPPYWDMLNMKGAENQAKRRQKGLQTNYSDSEKDLGNIADYREFLEELRDIYFKMFDLLVAGGYLTIIVKNIKKKGRNFPLAWDLSLELSQKYIVCQESFWFQDDLRIAPYGYGNTWVSNTFHHYCLTFQKPAGKP